MDPKCVFIKTLIFIKGTSQGEALPVETGVFAGYFFLNFNLGIQLFTDEFNRLEKGQVNVAFTATGTSMLGNSQ